MLTLFTLAALNTSGEAEVGQEEEAVDALVMQEADAEATKQEVDTSHVPKDIEKISVMFSDSETEAKSEVETRTHLRVRPYVVESFGSEPEKKSKAKHDLPAPRATPTKKRTRFKPPKLLQLFLPFQLKQAGKNKNLPIIDSNLVSLFL